MIFLELQHLALITLFEVVNGVVCCFAGSAIHVSYGYGSATSAEVIAWIISGPEYLPGQPSADAVALYAGGTEN